MKHEYAQVADLRFNVKREHKLPPAVPMADDSYIIECAIVATAPLWNWPRQHVQHWALYPYLGSPPISHARETLDLVDLAGEIASYIRELKELESRIDLKLRELHAILPYVQDDIPADDQDDHVIANPVAEWVDKHRDILAKYPNSWVAVDPEQGIVDHFNDENDRKDFYARLRKLEVSQQERIAILHTSMYM